MAEPLRNTIARAPVLLVEDDGQIAKLLTAELIDAGFAVDWARNGSSGVRKHRLSKPLLILLDLNLPDLDGLEVCDQIRNIDASIPILMLTARASKTQVIQGLERGADDYLTKPFDALELMARIRALLRRTEDKKVGMCPAPGGEDIVWRTLRIDPTKRLTQLDGRAIDLTVKEFELLHLFARHPGRTFTRDELLRRIWGDGFEGYEHTVNTHINRLRNKIEKDLRHPTMIETVWGVGYRFTQASGSKT